MMTTVRVFPVYEATQYDGTDENVAELEKRFPGLVRMTRLQDGTRGDLIVDPFAIGAMDGPGDYSRRAKPGDWIVNDDHGRPALLTPGEFAGRFAMMPEARTPIACDPGPGIPSP